MHIKNILQFSLMGWNLMTTPYVYVKRVTVSNLKRLIFGKGDKVTKHIDNQGFYLALNGWCATERMPL